MPMEVEYSKSQEPPPAPTIIQGSSKIGVSSPDTSPNPASLHVFRSKAGVSPPGAHWQGFVISSPQRWSGRGVFNFFPSSLGGCYKPFSEATEALQPQV